jgi:hypothetical protein
MQSSPLRPSRRSLRTSCPRCDRAMELQRMREHLRDAHHLETVELDAVLLTARKDAIRGLAHPRAQ